MGCITQRDKSFLLSTERSAYMLMVNEHGHLEHLHYGAPVSLDDAEALRYKHTIQYGSQVLYEPKDESYCMDNVPLEWSGLGKGDFRITPIELLMPDGSYTTDFVYEGCEIKQGVCPAETLPGAYVDNAEDAETLIIYMHDRLYELSLRLVYTVFPKVNVISRRAVLTNGESSPVLLRRLMSMLIDLPARSYKLVTFDGDWIKEAHRHDRVLQYGCFVNESTTGFSSSRHNPGVLLACEGTGEDYGEAYGFNLVYSGNHYTAVERSPRDMVRVVSGINPLCFNWTLAKGESFETPESVMTYSADGLNALSHNFHDFINRHIVRGEWRGAERPVLLNNWEAHFFKFTRRKLLRLARRAKKLGVELFVLDDGWFGARNDDKAGLGDYKVNRKKLPGGLEALSRSVCSMGMRFGLWFEPESVNIDSELYRAHPDWAVKLPERAPSFGRNQLLLDLTRGEVRDYIVENVTRILDSAQISYVKWDMNRHMSDVYSAVTPAGEFYHRYIMGLYDVLGRIFRPRPHILFESCSSGGNRFDLGMLCFSQQIWASDDTDPIERLDIQKGLSYLYPLSTMGAHVSQAPHQQTLRLTPLSTRFNVAAFGALGYELDLGELSRIEKQQVKEQIAFYKKHRKTLQFGTFYRSELPDDNKELFICAERDGSKALASLVQTRSYAAQSGDSLRLKGLDENSRYTVDTVPQRVQISRFGGLVKHLLPIALKPDGFVLRTANRLYALADGGQHIDATGAALAAGAGLNNQYIGTGYDPNLRIWGDFGSQLYIAERKEEQ